MSGEVIRVNFKDKEAINPIEDNPAVLIAKAVTIRLAIEELTEAQQLPGSKVEQAEIDALDDELAIAMGKLEAPDRKLAAFQMRQLLVPELSKEE
jgi:tRNA pseudouridine-54 N-methylase